MFDDLRLYFKLRPDIKKLKELFAMHISVNVAGQIVLTLLHMVNVFTPMVPAKYKFLAMAAIGAGNLVLSVLAHYSNPDGSPASLPAGLTNDDLAQYQKIFGNTAKLVAFLAIAFAAPARAQVMGTVTDAPQHVVGAGGGCDGNRQCSGDAFFAEKLTGATYSVSYVEFVPSFLTTTTPAALGSSANLTTNTTTSTRTLSIKPIVSTGVEQIVWQSGRLSAAVGGMAGFALPSGAQPSVNFSTGEHVSLITRLNKTLNTAAGTGNWYLAMTAYMTQILGVPDGQTWALRLNFLHGANGSGAK